MSRFPLSLRLFVDPRAPRPEDGRIELTAPDAARAYLLGARRGLEIVLLDGSGWETSVLLGEAGPDRCGGRIIERRVAAEPRTKVSLYHALSDPEEAGRLVRAATAVGAVAIISLITDRSLVPMAGSTPHEDPADLYAPAARDAAERAGRGRVPRLRGPILFDHALDGATRSGAALIAFGALAAEGTSSDTAGGTSAASGVDAAVTHRGRGLRSSTIEAALAGRAFSVAVFCPPQGGFTAEELDRADARGAAIVPPPPVSAAPDESASATAQRAALWATLTALDAVMSAADSAADSVRANPRKP